MEDATKWRIRKGLISIAERTLGMLPVSFVRCLYESSLHILHNRGTQWITNHYRPKVAEAEYYLPSNPVHLSPSEKYAIVLQGPIVSDENFTVESIRYYRRMYPEAVVILSTWEDEPAAAISRCRAAGADVVLSAKPAIPGAINVNFQVRSSLAGMLRAKELKCSFAAKTRADLRIFAPHAFRFLISLLRTFPCRNTDRQNCRIISTDLGTARYMPYYLSDHILFGEIEDMCRYWSCPTNELSPAREKVDGIIKNIVPEKIPEMFLCRSFLQRTDGVELLTLRSWWQALADRFLIVDREMLDAYWPKYHPHAERASALHERYLAWNSIYFRDWLRLYDEFGPNSEVPEHLLGRPAMSLPPFRLESDVDPVTTDDPATMPPTRVP